MVAVDAQILAGVAVTVLLALLFFGVVVLWDVALALRGVADKVDKLEDTLDDDLTDLERAVDGSPGGSGAQVHLNGGGTITPGGAGAAAGTQAPPGQRRGATGGPTAQPAHAASEGQPAAERAGEPTAGSPSAEAAADAAGVERAGRSSASAEDDGPERSDRSVQSREAIGADPTPVRESSPTDGDRSDDDGEAEDHDGSPEDQDGTDPHETHPRAAVNRGRFITSPDRTAWYRTSLDRESIAEARSPIAGELEAGDASPAETGDADDEPVAAEAPAESQEEPIVVGPGGPDETVGTTESADDRTRQSATEPESADSAPSSGAPRSDADPSDGPAEVGDDPDDSTEAGGDPNDSPAGDEMERRDRTPEEPDDDAPDRSTADDRADGTAVAADQDAVADEGDVDGDGEPGAGGTDSTEATDDGVAPTTDEGAEPTDDAVAPETESAESASESERQPEGALANAEPSEPERASEADDSDDEAVIGDEPDATDDATGTEDAADAPIDESDEAFDPDGDMEFTFEEFSPAESTGPELSVDEAVESVNDETPTLSRSTHGIESRAETDDDGVVLVYDLEGTDSSGSTTRLLRYQLQSFAAESDAEVDVSVSGNRVVVDISGADGADVSQWQSAVVEVIDRTLYLSDNSE